MTKRELYDAVSNKYADESGIIRGFPVAFLFNLSYGTTEADWRSEISPNEI